MGAVWGIVKATFTRGEQLATVSWDLIGEQLLAGKDCGNALSGYMNP